MDLPFLPERKKIEKCFSHKSFKTCCSHKSFKTDIKSWINTKKVYRVIQFNQEAWLKPYIDMSTKLRTEAKNDFEKDFLTTE